MPGNNNHQQARPRTSARQEAPRRDGAPSRGPRPVGVFRSGWPEELPSRIPA